MTIHFNVKTGPVKSDMQAEPGKALVIVVAKEIKDTGTTYIGKITTRVGLDGTWVGANRGSSYVAFSADPGEHRLCTDWQSTLSALNKLGSAVTFTAEPGKQYYFQTMIDEREHHETSITLEPLDPAQAHMLMANSSLSSSTPQKR